MDKVAIALRLVEIAPKFLPRTKPPVIDYSVLYSGVKAVPAVASPEIDISAHYLPVERAVAPVIEQSSYRGVEPGGKTDDISTACISCSRSHLSAVSGALGEAIRFARENKNIMHPEVQRRIMLSEDEIVIMERIDLAPDALAASPPEEREIVEAYLPRIRKLRQNLGNITSYERLEETAVEASMLAQEFRLAALQARGVDLSPVLTLARQVQSGEIDMETAKSRLKEILPDEGEKV